MDSKRPNRNPVESEEMIVAVAENVGDDRDTSI